jgi:hypothetical protein
MASPFASPATGQQGSRRSVSIAPPQAGRGIDCPRRGCMSQPARLHLAPVIPMTKRRNVANDFAAVHRVGLARLSAEDIVGVSVNSLKASTIRGSIPPGLATERPVWGG